MLNALIYLSRDKRALYSYRKGYNDYYEDTWLIMHIYWKFDAPDIMPLMPRLMRMYDVTQDHYKIMTLEDRCNRDAALNTQFRLLVELLACDFPCKKTDFKLPTGPDSLKNSSKIWEKMCLATGEKFHRII